MRISKLTNAVTNRLTIAVLADPKAIEIMLNSDGKSDYPIDQALLR